MRVCELAWAQNKEDNEMKLPLSPSPKDGAQDLPHVKQGLYHLAIASPSRTFFKTNKTDCGKCDP